MARIGLISLLVSCSFCQICEEVYDEQIRDCHLDAYEVWSHIMAMRFLRILKIYLNEVL